MTEQTPNKADLLLPLTMAAMSNSYDNEETADEDGFPDDSPQKKSNPTKKTRTRREQPKRHPRARQIRQRHNKSRRRWQS